jgi:hypothetical protein
MKHASTILINVLFWGFIAALAAVPLNAQAFKFRFGSQLSVVNPVGDLSDIAQLGIGADLLSFEFCFGNHFAIRENTGSVLFGKKNKFVTYSSYFGDAEEEVEHRILGIGVSTDFIFRAKSHDKGLFWFVGLGTFIFSTKAKSRFYYNGSNYGGGDYSNSDFVFAASTGMGYKFNRNWGLEIRYAKSLTPVGNDLTDFYGYLLNRDNRMSFDWIQVSLIQRF